MKKKPKLFGVAILHAYVSYKMLIPQQWCNAKLHLTVDVRMLWYTVLFCCHSTTVRCRNKSLSTYNDLIVLYGRLDEDDFC